MPWDYKAWKSRQGLSFGRAPTCWPVPVVFFVLQLRGDPTLRAGSFENCVSQALWNISRWFVHEIWREVMRSSVNDDDLAYWHTGILAKGMLGTFAYKSFPALCGDWEPISWWIWSIWPSVKILQSFSSAYLAELYKKWVNIACL